MNARLSRGSRLIYASGAIGGNAIGRSKDLWLIYYYAPPDDADIERRVSTIAVGVTLFLIRFIEAFDDPLIGYLSDRTRSRWGRRIPYVIGATPFLAIFFVLLWVPPTADESLLNVLYLFVVLWFFHLFSTLSGGPFESLLPEIAPDADERVSIVTWQVAFGVVGAVLALVVSGVIVDAWGFQQMAILMAVVALISRFYALSGIWDRAMVTAAETRPSERLGSFREDVLTCLRNDQFVAFVPSYIFYNMGVLMMTGVLPFLAKEVLEKEDEGTMVTLMTAAAISVLVLSLPLVIRLTRLRSKRWVYAAGMLYGAAFFPLLFFVGFVPSIPKDVQAIVFAALVGLPMAPLQAYQGALIADITDYDALRTGVHREGTYYATQATFEKTASALSPLLLTLLLTLGSTTDNPIGIRLVGPVAGASTFIGYIVFRRYRLPDHVTAETARHLLDARSGRSAVRHAERGTDGTP